MPLTPLVHPGHYRGAQSDDARFKRLQLMIEKNQADIAHLLRIFADHHVRLQALEAKRGPGRPPKDYSEMRSGLSECA
jgi:hypothetical protein